MRIFDEPTFKPTEEQIKEYFKKRNYFGIPKYTCDKAEELIVYTKNYLIKNKTERKKAEKMLGGGFPETEVNYPFTIFEKFGKLIYSSRTEDFAQHLPNVNKLELYLIQSQWQKK